LFPPSPVKAIPLVDPLTNSSSSSMIRKLQLVRAELVGAVAMGPATAAPGPQTMWAVTTGGPVHRLIWREPL